jgi:hypothetical protein
MDIILGRIQEYDSPNAGKSTMNTNAGLIEDAFLNFSGGTGGASLTGGTYAPATGTETFYDVTGVVFSVTGFSENIITGGTYAPATGTVSFSDKTGAAFSVAGFSKSYTTLSYANPLIWNVNLYPNARVTLTGNTTLSLSGLANGSEGNLIVKQGLSTGNTITLSGGSLVANGGGGTITLAKGTNAVDILTFTHDGVNTFFSLGYNFN